MAENRYNLVDEAWVPVADAGLVSVREVFQNERLRSLGGSAVHKIALLKFLLALAQAAHTPEDDAAWARLGPQGLGRAVLAYLAQWHDRFWLYGERPFLQMPAVRKAALATYGVLMPEVATGNTTVLTQWQCESTPDDATRALLLLVNMSLCFSGKKVDNSVTLTPGHAKSASARSGPGLCHMGLLHSFLTGESLLETVWLNLQTAADIKAHAIFTEGLGVPPWEAMPQGEACATAQKLRCSLMGRLVPLARFCLLTEDGVHFVEGIQHPDYQQGYADPSTSMRTTGKKIQMLWCDPGKRPWRSLTALLSFLRDQHAADDFRCPVLATGLNRLPRSGVKQFGIWSGGIRVSSNAGEQYLSGDDDLVESEVILSREAISTGTWFEQLEARMLALESMGSALYAAVAGYYTALKDGAVEKHARAATHLFWQMAERHFPALLEACDADAEQRLAVMQRMAGAAHTAYQLTCPQDTARQIQTWARHRPRLGKFLLSS